MTEPRAYSEIRQLRLRGRSNPAHLHEPYGPGVVQRVPNHKSKISGPLLFVYIAWAHTLMDPHRWLGFGQGETLFLLAFIFLLFFCFPQLLTAKRLVWFTPLMTYLLSQWVMIPFADNTGIALSTFKITLYYLLLALVTVNYVKTLKQTLPILFIYLLQYAWWTAHGSRAGFVGWHPTLGNQDGFGPYMVIGFVYCFYFGMAVKSRKYKWLAYILATLCVLGVVASFARGAVLSLALVVITVWLRSPKKGSTTLSISVALVVGMIAIGMWHSNGEFWAEMQSAFTDGTDQGTNGDRWALWKASIRVFEERPLLGVGPGNFGVFAASFFEYGDVGGLYIYPERLYGRQLHNIYFQVLSEGGIVGSSTMLFLIYSFFLHNRKLRTRAYIQAWNREVGEKLDLVPISIGLEILLIAFLATGFFYDQLYVHWLYTAVTLNAILFRLTQESMKWS